MLDILMYLFENFVHNDNELFFEQKELEQELNQAGFNGQDISKAFVWLEHLSQLKEVAGTNYNFVVNQNSHRVYSHEECQQLSVECRGFILFLEQAKILNAQTREMVIDRLMALESRKIEIEDIKWVILMVLFNAPDSEEQYTHMEDILFESPELDRLQ